ncbi:MAG TPA: TetR/AcrR family transcriptional regulator [Myxococcota bacterium]|nr:TetR/AcrR family transcriptional regulator [Myxococcota bacterium]
MSRPTAKQMWLENHERLYTATLEEIERVGFDEVRIDRICQVTQLSRPTFYAHFQNKDSVISELLCRLSDGVARGLEAEARRSRDLASVIDALVRLCQDANAGTPARIRGEVAAYIARHQDIDQFSTSVRAVLSCAIAEAIRRQEIRPVSDPQTLARRIAVVVNGFFAAYPTRPDKAASEAREMLRLVLEGLRRG